MDGADGEVGVSASAAKADAAKTNVIVSAVFFIKFILF